MKKQISKISAVLVALAMLMALTVTAFAADITNNSTSHTYKAFQIFTGTYSNGKLTNLKWGTNGTGETGEAVDSAVTDAINAVANDTDQAKLEVITQYADISDASAAYTIAAGETVNVADGYYLIKDADGSVEGNDAYTLYIVKVSGEALTISPKSSVPTMNKKIKDTNDSVKEDTTGWQDSADYDIGDEVPLKLTGTVASNYDDYDNYYYAFHDKEEQGLTFNADSVEVQVDGKAIAASLYEVDETDEGFNLIIPDLKETAATKDSTVEVYYTSTLNSEAHTGNYGNVNEAWLEYANNPNDTTPTEDTTDEEGKPEDTGETVHDAVIVFTYQVEVNKTDSEGNALTGAEFTLSKVLADGTTKAIAVVKNDAGTTFTFNGLDDGTYVLSETATPDGYNSINDQTFTVTASHNPTWEGLAASDNRTEVLTALTGEVTSGDIEFAADSDYSTLSTTVVNYEGATLPTTGGIGTVIFYVLGTILVLGAGIFLVTKIRVQKEN